MHAERQFRAGKAGGKNEVGLVSGAKVAHPKVGKDCSGCVESGSVRVVLCVPFELNVGQQLWGIFGS